MKRTVYWEKNEFGEYKYHTVYPKSRVKPGIYEIVLEDNADEYWLGEMDFVCDSYIEPQDGNPLACILNELKVFWESKSKYESLGFTYKRGFILHGSPGGGKTSYLINISEKIVKLGGLVVFASFRFQMALKFIKKIRDSQPNIPIVLIIEDIEQHLHSYEELLLSFLDGEEQINNIITIATTNYLDSLPGRLINRPSRFDTILELGAPDYSARRNFLKSKVNTLVPEATIDEWATVTAGLVISHLKEFLILVYIFNVPVKEAVMRVKKIENEPNIGCEVEEGRYSGMATVCSR